MKKLLIAACMLLFSSLAYADHWNVDTMNEAINQTNFIVGEGRGHCSGTLISVEERLILTNHHCIGAYVRYRTKEVVENGVVVKKRVEELRDVTVAQRAYADYQLVGETSYKTVIVARWKESDLALLRFRTKDIPYTIAAKVYNKNGLKRGMDVFVVGNPQMMDTSVTKGIISSVQRTYRVPWADNQPVPFLQVDAGISGGNSGGSLYNLHGELVGVPAARMGDSTLGLAIPFFRVQELLTRSCYERVWNPEGESREDCMEKGMDGEASASDTDPVTFCGAGGIQPLSCSLPTFRNE